MAECACVCEHVHLPLQSGSSRLLKAMRRTYTRERYLALAEKMRAAIPDLAFGTDIIVGFPGETEDDFRETLEVVEEVGYDSAFTFVYSPRAGTEAAAMPDQVPHEVKIERMERLVELTQQLAHDRNETRVGRVEQVLVEGPSRTDPSVLRGPHAAQHHGELHRRRHRRARSSTCSSRERPRPRSGAPSRPWSPPDRSITSIRQTRAMRILVTGSSGQIGTNLALRLLKDGHEVFGVDKRPNSWVDNAFPTLLQDLAGHYSAFRGGINGVEYPEVDLVVHLAAHAKVHQLVRQPHRALENAIMTFNVLEYARGLEPADRLLVDAARCTATCTGSRSTPRRPPTSPSPRARTRRRRSRARRSSTRTRAATG